MTPDAFLFTSVMHMHNGASLYGETEVLGLARGILAAIVWAGWNVKQSQLQWLTSLKVINNSQVNMYPQCKIFLR